MNYLTKWFDEVQSRHSMSLSSSVTVSGVRDQHMGPRWERAKIEVRAEPAASFDVRFGPDIDQSDRPGCSWKPPYLAYLNILLVYRIVSPAQRPHNAHSLRN